MSDDHIMDKSTAYTTLITSIWTRSHPKHPVDLPWHRYIDRFLCIPVNTKVSILCQCMYFIFVFFLRVSGQRWENSAIL